MLSVEANLKNQVALITGGSQGIGASTAITLGKAGASVVITYNRSKSKAMEVLDELKRSGARAIALPLDLPNDQSIRSMVSRTMEEFGRIDILVNNAAVGSASVAHYTTPEKEDQAMLEINTLGSLFCAQAVLPIMIKQAYGKIINISSVGGGVTVFPKFRASDEMSKCAVGFMTKQIVADHPYERIDAFAVCPGAVNTRMFRESTLDHLSQADREAFISQLPMRRLIDPQEIADLILFLCTPSATVCRGAVIDASLGLGVRPGLISEKK